MSEWWTYRLGDFLMFSPATYWRMVANYHQATWPAQVVGLVGGVAALWLTTLRGAGAARVQALLLAVAWLWVGWAFHWQRYSTINWAATYFALAFAAQALMLAALAFTRRAEVAAAGPGASQTAGWLLAVSGLVGYPLIGAWAGQPWSHVEIFGVSPEPTALVSLGVLLAGPQQTPRWGRWVLAVIPTLSLLAGAATLLAMARL
ncbi:MAG TPA: DUF6064 family protein [Polaromonas sp.]|uniref:DUF6064 family protein n=2 Tax=Polaromonas sp. TaxID=1869339 RepID=UPI002BB2667E|nr:DUF6064 family protein [Polaromonas sp.]HQS32411.1 DUF6064 family protein [Polaromonas sp.]